jgi:hypothetical protein
MVIVVRSIVARSAVMIASGSSLRLAPRSGTRLSELLGILVALYLVWLIGNK